jgi:hypothetical protein
MFLMAFGRKIGVRAELGEVMIYQGKPYITIAGRIRIAHAGVAVSGGLGLTSMISHSTLNFASLKPRHSDSEVDPAVCVPSCCPINSPTSTCLKPRLLMK